MDIDSFFGIQHQLSRDSVESSTGNSIFHQVLSLSDDVPSPLAPAIAAFNEKYGSKEIMQTPLASKSQPEVESYVDDQAPSTSQISELTSKIESPKASPSQDQISPLQCQSHDFEEIPHQVSHDIEDDQPPATMFEPVISMDFEDEEEEHLVVVEKLPYLNQSEDSYVSDRIIPLRTLEEDIQKHQQRFLASSSDSLPPAPTTTTQPKKTAPRLSVSSPKGDQLSPFLNNSGVEPLLSPYSPLSSPKSYAKLYAITPNTNFIPLGASNDIRSPKPSSKNTGMKLYNIRPSASSPSTKNGPNRNSPQIPRSMKNPSPSSAAKSAKKASNSPNSVASPAAGLRKSSPSVGKTQSTQNPSPSHQVSRLVEDEANNIHTPIKSPALQEEPLKQFQVEQLPVPPPTVEQDLHLPPAPPVLSRVESEDTASIQKTISSESQPAAASRQESSSSSQNQKPSQPRVSQIPHGTGGNHQKSKRPSEEGMWPASGRRRSHIPLANRNSVAAANSTVATSSSPPSHSAPVVSKSPPAVPVNPNRRTSGASSLPKTSPIHTNTTTTTTTTSKSKIPTMSNKPPVSKPWK